MGLHPCFKEGLEGKSLEVLTSVVEGGFPPRLKKERKQKLLNIKMVLRYQVVKKKPQDKTTQQNKQNRMSNKLSQDY